MPTYTIDPRTRPSDPFVAEVLRRLLARGPDSLDPWLPFPQNACSFHFGRPPRPKQPLPIGALWRLWDSGFPFRAPCPACDAMLHTYAMGGLLTIGGGLMVCPGCSGGYSSSIGGLSRVGALVEERLQGSEFQPSGFVFGGAVGSDGAALLAELGLAGFAQAEEGVVVRADGLRTRVGFDVPESLVEEERGDPPAAPRQALPAFRRVANGRTGDRLADHAAGGARAQDDRRSWVLLLNRLRGR